VALRFGIKFRIAAATFDISRNHLLKVVRRLGALGLIRTTRGRNGGLALARPAERIGLGEVVRHIEGRLEVMNCADPPCPIRASCLLRSALDEARDAFLATLDRYRLATLIEQREPALRRLLQM
jgi:Rrf2 family nitric oxide-sensitive transcriptional repressor